MLGEQTRKVLFWVSVLVVVVVTVSGMVSVLRLLIRPSEGALPLQVTPAETVLCTGQQVAFSVEPELEDLEWAVTGGGEISPDGNYSAGELPGDYEVQVAGPRRGQRGRAVVHIVVCTPTPTITPVPTAMPSPTPTPAPTPLPAADPEGDVQIYGSRAPAAAPPAGVDIRNASVAADRRVTLQAVEGIPVELSGWATEGEALLWVALYQPVPNVLSARTDWLFALDLDGDSATGRPVGSARINPDLGMEAAVGLSYDPASGAYESYLLIWDPAVGNWETGPDVVRFVFDDSRTLVALALPVDTLQEEAARVTGVTLNPEAVVGRAAAVSYTTPETVIDLYPDPEG
jgi:hypothetical protein